MRTFIPNPGFVKELELDEKTVDAYVKAAEASADNANDLRHRFYREEGAVLVRNESSRVHLNVYIVNTDSGGHMDEWGSVNNEPYAPLRRGVENAGLEFQPLPK
jgi:hypothetical protein